jgi:hypothetical protein
MRFLLDMLSTSETALDGKALIVKGIETALEMRTFLKGIVRRLIILAIKDAAVLILKLSESKSRDKQLAAGTGTKFTRRREKKTNSTTPEKIVGHKKTYRSSLDFPLLLKVTLVVAARLNALKLLLVLG